MKLTAIDSIVLNSWNFTWILTLLTSSIVPLVYHKELVQLHKVLVNLRYRVHAFKHGPVAPIPKCRIGTVLAIFIFGIFQLYDDVINLRNGLVFDYLWIASLVYTRTFFFMIEFTFWYISNLYAELIITNGMLYSELNCAANTGDTLEVTKAEALKDPKGTPSSELINFRILESEKVLIDINDCVDLSMEIFRIVIVSMLTTSTITFVIASICFLSKPIGSVAFFYLGFEMCAYIAETLLFVTLSNGLNTQVCVKRSAL